MIKVEKLNKTVPSGDGELRILKGIDLEIKAGQSAAIVGPSGSGSLRCSVYWQAWTRRAKVMFCFKASLWRP